MSYTKKVLEKLAKMTILLSSLKMASGTFISRILGLVREQVLAAFFGAGIMTDAFFVAYKIPNVFRDLLAEGAFSAAFVPIFTQARQKSDYDARILLWSAFALLFLITLALTLFMGLFAPELISLFAPKFTQNPPQFDTAVLLLRIMAPFLIFASLAAIFMGALNSLHAFFIPSLAPAFFNIGIISCMIFLPKLLEPWGLPSVLAIAIGVFVGGFLQAFIQFPVLIKKAFGPIFSIKLWSESTRKILSRVGIGSIGVAAAQLNVLVTTILASSTVVGAVSWLTYSFRLFQFPVGIVGVSIGNSNLVHFSQEYKKGNVLKALEHLKQSYQLCFFLMIPASVLLYSLSRPAVHLVFEHGAFSSIDTMQTALCLKLYALALVFYGLYKVFVPVFYSLDRPKVAVSVSIISILCNIIFSLSLVPYYGFSVLALGTGLAMFLNVILQIFYLKKFLKLKVSFFFNFKILSILVSGLISLILCHTLVQGYFSYSESFLKQIFIFSSIAICSLLFYFISYYLIEFIIKTLKIKAN